MEFTVTAYDNRFEFNPDWNYYEEIYEGSDSEYVRSESKFSPTVN